MSRTMKVAITESTRADNGNSVWRESNHSIPCQRVEHRTGLERQTEWGKDLG